MIQLSPDSWLKPIEPSDTPDMFYLTEHNRVHLRKWLPWLDTVKRIEDSEQFILHTIEQHSSGQGIHFGIWYQGQLAGVVGVHGINWANRRTEIGYWLGADFQGKGLMTEAVAAYIDQLIFGVWNLNRVSISAATKNVRSRAIPERLGFQLEGIIRSNEYLYDRFIDHAVYGMLASDWKR